MNFVYIARCSDGTLYTGWTTDIQKREKTHNCGKGAKYTRSRRPIQIVYTENFELKMEALKREKEIKKLTKCQKEQLIIKQNKKEK